MRRLAEILGVYEKLDQHLEKARSADPATAPHLQAQQALNDQAYFLLCWGQLESQIDDRCRAVIRRAQQSTTWLLRRGWDLYNPNDKRLSGLSFEDRTAIVLDKNAGKGSAFARTMSHYQMRNEIAHGALRATRVDVVAIAREFYTIQAALAP